MWGMVAVATYPCIVPIGGDLFALHSIVCIYVEGTFVQYLCEVSVQAIAARPPRQG